MPSLFCDLAVAFFDKLCYYVVGFALGSPKARAVAVVSERR